MTDAEMKALAYKHAYGDHICENCPHTSNHPLEYFDFLAGLKARDGEIKVDWKKWNAIRALEEIWKRVGEFTHRYQGDDADIHVAVFDLVQIGGIADEALKSPAEGKYAPHNGFKESHYDPKEPSVASNEAVNGKPAESAAECLRCKDWQRQGLSNKCPDCDKPAEGLGFPKGPHEMVHKQFLQQLKDELSAARVEIESLALDVMECPNCETAAMKPRGTNFRDKYLAELSAAKKEIEALLALNETLRAELRDE